MSLGMRYLIAWPALSLLLGAGWVLLCKAVRRDDARNRAQRARYARTRL